MRSRLNLVLLVAADATALVALFPGARFASHLSAPRLWVAQAGADAAAAQLAAAGLWLAAGWLGLGLGAALAAQLPGALGRNSRRLAQRLLPRAVMRLIAGAAGLGVLLTPVVAGAAPRTPVTVTSPAWPTSTPPTAPAWPSVPSAAPQTADPAYHGRPNRPASEPQIVVAPGDSLWSIAADHLPPPRRTPARVAAAWPRWYAANHRVIGTDPDHIEVGQVLHLPTSPKHPTETG
jgi:resuscitation-promoting factor RpfA